jgi:acyl carrier protein
MLLNDFVQKFAGCFHQTDPASISGQTRFRELEEWGSMMALIVIAMVDSDFGKTVTADDLKSAETVEALFVLVKNK